MPNKYQASGLVTDKISKNLADKLKDHILQGGVVTSSGNLDLVFYVSANGSNESGDGSQEHPFRTIEHIKSI